MIKQKHIKHIDKILYLLFLPFFAYSPITNPAIQGQRDESVVNEATSGVMFFTYAIKFWKIAIIAGTLLVLVYYVWAAIDYLTSGDKADGVKKAKTKFMNATIGAILVASSYTITVILNRLIFGNNFNIFNINLDTVTEQPIQYNQGSPNIPDYYIPQEGVPNEDDSNHINDQEFWNEINWDFENK